MSHKVCSVQCAIDLVSQNREKVDRAKVRASNQYTKVLKLAFKPLSWWAGKAQKAVNDWIRERDKADGCISCGIRTGKMNAGHYRSRGACPALRYHQDNIHKQCEQCNTSKSGNSIEYRIRLREKIGDEQLAWIEGPHELKRMRKEDYQAIEAEHKAKLKKIYSDV